MDLKKTNLNEQFKFLLARQDILAYIVMAVVILLVAIKFHSFQLGKINRAKNRIVEENKKNDLISNIGKVERKILPYREFLSRKEQMEIINDVSRIAREIGVKVNSIQPLAVSKEDGFTKISFSLSLEATYHKLGKFINRLERSQMFLRMERLNLAPIATSAQRVLKSGYNVSLDDTILRGNLTLSILYLE